jgi:signal transduction histidine kinase
MTPQYDPLLVVTSVAIAIFASYVALDMTARLSGQHHYSRWLWWLCAPVAMGLGIWSMHFVGMLAFHLPVPVRYDGLLVLLSVLVAIGASALALFVASRTSLPLPVLGLASLSMGAAINGMHYIGMAAMRLPAIITWQPDLVALSVVIAVGASFAALLMAFRLRATASGLFHWSKLGAATLMGLAISGMHYTGMAAAQFTPAAIGLDGDTLSLHTTGMAVGVIVGTVAILSMALAGAAFNERARLLAMEQHARGEAEAANRLKDEFLATLSHELRTPLNVILGRLQMLRAHAADPAKVTETTGTITRNAEALRHVVEDLLDVSRMTLGGMHLERQPVDMAALLDAAADSIRAGAHAKGVRLAIHASRGQPRVIGDAARLQQVIWNLLTNAVKFTPPGGQVRVDLGREGPHIVLTVTDTGRGIDPGFLPHVFDMFRQAEPSASRTEGGLGIGLSIVQRLVELHGGTASAGSAGLDHGATFTVRLPHQAAETTKVRRRHADPLAMNAREP